MEAAAQELRKVFLRVFMVLACAGSAFSADKSAVGPRAISVPKGPGSIEGLGESFQPTLNTGTAKYGWASRCRPARPDMHPVCAFPTKAAAATDRWASAGACRCRYIQRRTDKGIPTYGQNVGFARRRSFINEMKEELVPQADGYWFCENEGAFIRYRRVGDHWEGTAPDGTATGVWTHRQWPRRRTGPMPPTSSAGCWKSETDTHGNVIVYIYAPFPGAQNLNQKYLVEIRYGPGGPPWTELSFRRIRLRRSSGLVRGLPRRFSRANRQAAEVDRRSGTQGPTLANHLAGDFNSDGTPIISTAVTNSITLNYAGTNSHWSLLAKVPAGRRRRSHHAAASHVRLPVCNPPDELSRGRQNHRRRQ